MSTAYTEGLKFIDSLYGTGVKKPELLLTQQAPSGWFLEGEEQDLYEFISAHIRENGKLPHPETLLHDYAYTVGETDESPQYYLGKMKNRHFYSVMAGDMTEIHGLLKANKVEEALKVWTHTTARLVLEGDPGRIVNFKEDGHQLVHDEFVAMNKGYADYIDTGWKYLDEMMLGLRPGDFLGMVGRPGMGKTYQLLHMARHTWRAQQKIPLFVSMEMKPLLLSQRLAAMDNKVAITHLKNGQLGSKEKDRLFTGLEELRDSDQVPFWILDGNLAATVNEIEALVQLLQPDVVFVDGAYLLQHPNPKIQKWEKIGANAEQMKQEIATRLGVPVVASYQLNRNHSRDIKKGIDSGLENIAGADIIGQIASVVLAADQDESLEQANRMRIKVKKGRSGEKGEFIINWVFDDPPFMDFSQIEEKPPGHDEAKENAGPEQGEVDPDLLG
jgi:KaiC/GvpD/RAD55 family RecA-like ATPase